MQDNNEDIIWEREEGNREMIHEREEWDEGGDWGPKSEDVEAFNNEQEGVTPWGSTYVHFQGPPIPKKHREPCKRVLANST